MTEYSAHETAVIDKGCTIGKGTKIWHFSHIMPNCVIGERCNIGQNVVVSPQVTLGNNVKNDTLIYRETNPSIDLTISDFPFASV